MMKFTALLLLLVPFTAFASTRPPTFKLDYATAPVARWKGALAMASQGKSWDELWGKIFTFHNDSLFKYVTPEMYTQMGDALQKYFPEQAEELVGISSQFTELFPGQFVSYEYLAAWAYYHELAHTDLGSNPPSRECTGLLAADSSGVVHHVANMDQSPTTIRNVTLHIQFVNASDDVLFQGVDWYWFTTGATRMVMPGVASFQENWRSTTTRNVSDVLEEIEAGVIPQTYVFRKTFEEVLEDPSIEFEELVDKMSTIPLASPYYVVMAGPEKMQGAVVARDPTGVAAPGGVLRLGENDGAIAESADPELSTWAIVQTNYDHWVTDPERDPRRTVGENTLSSYGQEDAATSLGLYAVASTYPVHNPTTAYTAVMDPRTGDMHAFVRVGMCPADSKADHRYCEDDSAQGFGAGAGAKSSASDQVRSSVPTWAYTIMVILAVLLVAMIAMFFNLKSQNRVGVFSNGHSKGQYESVP